MTSRFFTILVALTALLSACMDAGPVAVQEQKAMLQQTSTATMPESVSLVPDPGDPYSQPLTPLTTRACGQCHYSVFTSIRDHGGKHQLECGYCHENYHTWKPGRPWQDVVPACASCHGAYHGEQVFLDCLSCHSNAHAPIHSLIAMDILAASCGQCHEPQNEELSRFPSAHSEIACDSCHHSRHGLRPECIECHDQPHMAYSSMAACQECHPVHKPMQISIASDTSAEACAGCHAKVTDTWRNGSRKHSQLACVYCHADQHPHVPSCRDCHSQPHSEGMLARFPGCASCHGDPHELQLR